MSHPILRSGERSTGDRNVMKPRCSRYAWAFALFGAALVGSSCTDMTETPFTEITEANFKPTASDLAAMIAPVYTPQRAIWMSWYGMVDHQSETSDDLISPVRPNGWYDGGTYIRLHEHRWDANQGQPAGVWTQSYNGINAANRVIYQIDAGILPLEGATKTAIVAELRAMRAWYYWLLLDNFGNVPIVTDFTSTELPDQATRTAVYNFVVKELTEAIPDLPVTPTGVMYGRMHQWAAKGALMRVYLNAQVYSGTPQLDKVIALADEIIASNRFRLDATYRAPFARNNNISPEIIFAVPYDAVFAGNSGGAISNFHMKTLKADLRFLFNMTVQPWGGISSAPQFVDSYDTDDGRYADTWMMGPQYDAQNRGYTFVKHVKSIQESGCYCAGFPVRKYELYQGMTGSSDVDYPAIRYAEVLMAKAEALLRKGDGAGAAALVTQVRTRNFKGAVAGKATVTGAELMAGSRQNYGWYDTDGVVKTAAGGTPVTNGGADIQYGRFLDELGWEFVAEGQRRTQLIRFGVFTTKTYFNHKPNGDHRIVFAIPQARLNTNSKLKQNPGY
jgi:starch-binding outer membrane protein, SusD/RagB family